MDKQKSGINTKNNSVEGDQNPSQNPNFKMNFRPGAKEDRKRNTKSEKKNTSADANLRGSSTSGVEEFERLLNKKRLSVKGKPQSVKI